MKKQSYSNQEIIRCLETYYLIAATKLTLLPLGADMNATIYKATAYDQSYFVKLKHGHGHDNSIVMLELLHENGIQVILPIKTIHGQLKQYFKNSTLIVYPFIEGQDGFSRNLSDDQWRKLGKNLRQLHEIKVPVSLQKKIRHEIYSSKWRELLKSYYIDMASEITHDEIALKLSTFIRENMQVIRHLVNQTETLAHKMIDQTPEFVLCHADIHGGNVLIDEKGTLYIVDWDDPIMAPKERDLMFIGGGVANVWNNLHEERLFYEGYGKNVINNTILAYYRHERIIEDIAEYVQVLLLTNLGGEDRTVMYDHFVDMFKPNGVIDIAFRTNPNSL